MATIASMLAGSILVTAAGHPEAVPLVIGAGNALLAALNGASGSQVLLAAGVGAAASIVGAGVGGVAGAGLYSATNSTLVAQLGGAVAGAAAASAMTAACYGGDVLRAIATGAAAAAFAVAYAAVEVYNAAGSPTLQQAPGSNEASTHGYEETRLADVGCAGKDCAVASDANPIPVGGQKPTLSKGTYGDVNLSGGWFGVGGTGGAMVNEIGFYPYVGGGFMTPGVSGAFTFSPSGVTPGWNVGLQVQFGVAGPVP